MSNEEVETKRDTVQFKKDKLMCHVPFIEGMIIKSKGTKFESKWQTMLKCIVSDKKKMTIAQIYQLDSTIKNRRVETNSNENEKMQIQQAPALPEEFKPHVPKPNDLSRPVLSANELQELIQELGPEPIAETANKAETKPKKEPLPCPVKIQLKKSPPMIRLPSSWIPSKSTPPPAKRSKIMSPPPLAGQSLLHPFKIPKKSPSSLSDSQKSSPSSDHLKKVEKLETINIFNRLNEHKMQQQLKKPIRWRASLLANNIKRTFEGKNGQTFLDGSGNALEVPADKNKKPQPEALDESAGLESSSELNISLDKTSEEMKSRTFESPPKELSFTEPEARDKVDSSEENVEQPATSSAEKFSECYESRKIQKEMRRLHENIVKDAVPLAPRRSCTLKRGSASYRDSPISTEGSSAEDQELPKKVKSDAVDAFVEPAEKAPLIVKRNAIKSVLVDASVEPAEKAPLIVKRKARKSVFVPTKKFSEPALDKLSPAAAKKGTVSLPADEQPEKASPARKTRQSVQVALDKTKEDEEKSPNEMPQKDQPSENLENIIKNYDIKPCAINLPSVSAEELIKLPTARKQTARKSTAPNRVTIGKSRKRPAPWNKGKKFTKALPASSLNMDLTNDDDQWEDVPENESASNDSKSEVASMSEKSESNEPVQGAYVYKTICNIAYTHCRDGIISKCMINDCCFQTLDKEALFKHWDTRHLQDKWSGFCMLCGKNVMSSKKGYELMHEFMHMIEHQMQEKATIEEIPEVSIPPEHDTESSEQSSAPDINLELLKGIDLILEELLPSEILKEKDDKEMAGTSNIQQPPFAPTLPVFQSPSLEATTIIPLQMTAAASNVKVETKVISKNIVGRVIKLPPSVLKNAKLLTVLSPPKTQAPPVVPVPKPTLVLTTPERVMKFVIKKPTVIKCKSTQPNTPAVKEAPSSQTSTDAPTSPPYHKMLKFESLASHPDVSINWMTTKELKDEMRFREILRPWLGIRTHKNLASMKVLTTPFALTATFKCLGTNCCFFTTSYEIFYSHLCIHKKFTPNDRDRYMSCAYCAYCTFETKGDPVDLVEHIETEHAYDKFQCHYCFYRSCVDFNVISHQNRFHKLKPRNILKIESKCQRNYSKELEIVKRDRFGTVPPIICVFCKSLFYVFKHFLNHVKSHRNTINTKCTKCGVKTTKDNLFKHLVGCHGFGLYQCVYCRHGSNSFEIMSCHIADKHPSKMPMLCERSENHADIRSASYSSSLDSTILRHINHNVDPIFVKNAPSDEVLLKNEVNKDQLCSNLPPVSKLKRPLATGTGNRPHSSGELYKKLQAQQIVRLSPLRAAKAGKICSIPDLGHPAPVANTPNVPNPPNVTHVLQPPLSQKKRPPIGLQIQNVFSLSTQVHNP